MATTARASAPATRPDGPASSRGPCTCSRRPRARRSLPGGPGSPSRSSRDRRPPRSEGDHGSGSKPMLTPRARAPVVTRAREGPSGMTEPVTAAPAAERIANVDEAWPRWYRPLVLLGLAISLVVSVAAFVSSVARQGASLDLLFVYLALPLGIIVSIVASRRHGASWTYLAAALLDIAAVLIAARAAIGLAIAIILPFAGLVLVLSVGGSRARRLALVGAWVASTAAIAVALTVGPISEITGLRNVGLAVASGAVFIAFVEVHLVLLTELRARAVVAAEAEIESRRQAEAELDRTSRLLSAIVDASPVPTQAFTTDGKVVLWNPASERVFGWSSEEVVGSRLPAEMTPLDEREVGAERIRRTFAGATANGERARRLSRDGRDVWVDIYAAPMVDAEGHTIGIAGQLVEVTERLALEDPLR